MERFSLRRALLLVCSSSIANFGNAQEIDTNDSLPSWLEGAWKVESIDVTVGGVEAPIYRLRQTEWMMFSDNGVYCISRSGWFLRVVDRHDFKRVISNDATALATLQKANGQPDHIPNCRWVLNRAKQQTDQNLKVDVSGTLRDLPGSKDSQSPSIVVTSIYYQWHSDSKQVRVEYCLTRIDDSELIYAATNSRAKSREGGSPIPHLAKLSNR